MEKLINFWCINIMKKKKKSLNLLGNLNKGFKW